MTQTCVWPQSSGIEGLFLRFLRRQEQLEVQAGH